MVALTYTKAIFVLLVCLFYKVQTQGQDYPNVHGSRETSNEWPGKWFPHPPSSEMETKQEVIMMGVNDPSCDDAKTDLAMDWDMSPINYTCYSPTNRYKVDINLPSILRCEKIPEDYRAVHFCMNESLIYDSVIPTYGDHRPLWPTFGEYLFVPKQRWLHSLEHGAIVMLYHPCAHPWEVERLKDLVTGCIRKHVITPDTNLPRNRPMALISWGCILLLSHVDSWEVEPFIKSHALNGPESTSQEGDYTLGLINTALPPIGSDMNDTVLCPKY